MLLLAISLVLVSAEPTLSKANIAAVERIIDSHSLAMELNHTPCGIPFHRLNVPADFQAFANEAPTAVLEICIRKAEKGTLVQALNACALGSSVGARFGFDHFAHVSAEEFSANTLRNGKSEREFWTEHLKKQLEGLNTKRLTTDN